MQNIKETGATVLESESKRINSWINSIENMVCDGKIEIFERWN